MAIFKRYQTPNGSHHPLGNRRVYSTRWLNTWVNWERDNAMTGPNGEVLTCYRPYDNGRGSTRKRVYVDMSMANIQINEIDYQPFDPVNTKYMTKHYINGKSLKELAHMTTNDFLRFIESLPCGRRHGRDGKGKHPTRIK